MILPSCTRSLLYNSATVHLHPRLDVFTFIFKQQSRTTCISQFSLIPFCRNFYCKALAQQESSTGTCTTYFVGRIQNHCTVFSTQLIVVLFSLIHKCIFINTYSRVSICKKKNVHAMWQPQMRVDDTHIINETTQSLKKWGSVLRICPLSGQEYTCK